MVYMNYEKILQSFLNFNLRIEQSYFKQTVFLEEEIEELYKREKYKSSKKNKIHSEAFLIFSFLAILIYIHVHNYRETFTHFWFGCLELALILIAFSHLKKNLRLNLFINHVLVFTISIFLNFKIIYIACYENTPYNDNDSEMIRTIVYSHVGSNVLAFVTLETRLPVSIFLFLLNFSAVLVAQLNSNENHHYYLDCLCNLALSIFFYIFKKIWDAYDRENFADKYRFEKLFNYTSDFIQGTNGYYINISKDLSICCDSKMKNLLNDMGIDGKTGKLRMSDGLSDCNDSSEINEGKCPMPINNSTVKEINGDLSDEVLNLFTLYEEKDLTNSYSISTKEKLGEKLKVLILESSSGRNLISVGKYKLKSIVCTKYFDVYFRQFSLNKNNHINEILIYDITELVTSKNKIYDEGVIKEKIMAKIVHEFKTPINSIIGVIGYLEDSLNSRNIIQNIKTIRNLSSYVIFLISDIIHFTNVKSLEEIKIIPQDINLREIANFGFDILQSLLRCNKSKHESIQPLIEFQEDIDSLIMKADEIRLKQIILNIISNAVKFTKSGWIKIKCSIAADIGRVIMSIEDTGVGIKKDEQENLFDDFYMVNNEAINNAMGSGLGLSICKSLAASMNIDISTSSTYGKGSEFSLSIPFKYDSFLCESLVNIMIDEITSEVDLENHIQLQENILIRNNRFCYTDLSDHMSDYKKIIRVPEFQAKPREVRRYKTNSIASKTLLLGMNDCINQSFRFINISSHNDLSSLKMSISSKLDSSYSIAIARSNRTVEINFERKEKILIVDDNYYNMESTKHILRKVLNEAGSGIEIITGSDGADIIQHIIQDQSKGNEIKCIITDENMEYINGSEAIRIIRNLESCNKIKFVNIISLTGNEESNSTKEIIRIGAQLVLGKPLQKTLIRKALKDLNII